MKARHWVAVGLLACVAFAAAVWLAVPRPRGFPVRAAGDGREVFVRTADRPDGVWLPLVESTAARLVETVPAQLTPGPVVHVNADGTALVTDAPAASRRIDLEGRGRPGWPPGPPPRASP